MEKISVIVPIYKIKEQYLKECIESISQQTYSNLEIILVDDGSPDNCGEICDLYAEKDSRIIVLHQKNQGVSMARNNAIQKATGEWITFIDADDWIEKNMCELAMEKSNRNDMVVWNMYLNRGEDQQIKKNYKKDIRVDDEKLLEKINLNFLRTISLSKDEIRIPTLEGPVCHLYKSNIIKENNIRFDSSLKQGEDKLFNYEYHKYIKRFTYINKPLYHYRLYDESTTHTFFAGNADTSTRILKKYYELEPRINTSETYRNTYCVRVGVIAYFLIGKYFLHPNNPNRKNAFREFKILMDEEPYKSAIAAIDLRPMDFNLNKMKLWLLKHRKYRSVFLYYNLVDMVKKIRGVK